MSAALVLGAVLLAFSALVVLVLLVAHGRREKDAARRERSVIREVPKE